MRFLIFAFFVLVFPSVIQAQAIKLPTACEKILNKNFKNWKPATIKPEIIKFLKENKRPFQANLIKGDWNGDKKIDYAVLISKGDQTKTIAFVADADDYQYFELTGGDFISLNKKGSKGFDHNKQKGFTFENDAITVVFWEKAAESFVWRKNKFVSIITSD